MMFAFRHFTPYLAATALALAHLAAAGRQSAAGRVSPRAPLTRRPWPHFSSSRFTSLKQMRCIADRSRVSARLGNMRRQGAAGYARNFIPAMKKNAADIRGSLGPSRPRATAAHMDLRSRRPSVHVPRGVHLGAARLIPPQLPAGGGRRATRRTRVESACGLHPRVHTPRQPAEAPGAGAETAGDD